MVDWQVGDVALCIKIGSWETYVGDPTATEADPHPGKSYIVACVEPCETVGLTLGFEEFWPVYDHRRFIKVTPPEADAFDREVIAALTGAPQEVG